MADYVFLGNKASNVDVSPTFDSYTKVIIHITDETAIEVGDDTGRTLEFDNPFGTRQMAEDLLRKLNGYTYQPYQIDGALLNPASEIGDTISATTAYGVIFTRSKQFGRLMKTDVSAPHDEEINHEYKFESPTERKFTREIADVRASIILQADKILAQVVKQVDGDTTSFGWTLTSDKWEVYSNGTPVLSVNRDGLEVAGTIKAGTKIGSGSGFTISAKAIYNNISSMSGTQNTGVYIGTDGIKLGQAFQVTSTGAVTATNISANNMTLTGTLTVGGQQITAASLRQGAERANAGYSSWNGTTSTVNANGGNWTNGYTWGNNFNQMAVYNNYTAKYVNAKTVNANDMFIYSGAVGTWKWVDSLGCFVLATYGVG